MKFSKLNKFSINIIQKNKNVYIYNIEKINKKTLKINNMDKKTENVEKTLKKQKVEKKKTEMKNEKINKTEK